MNCTHEPVFIRRAARKLKRLHQRFNARKNRRIHGGLRRTRSATFRLFAKKDLHNITPYGVMLNMDQLTDVLTAISHPSRRAIIGQLAMGPARFTDIARPFDTALNAVTKHLKLLERAGLIERKKQGREVFISFRGKPLRHVAGWMHEYERFWNERLEEFQQYFQDKKRKRRRSDE